MSSERASFGWWRSMNLHYNESSMTVRRLCSGSKALFMTLNI